MKTTKRFVSGFLAALCILSMSALPANAHSEGGDSSHPCGPILGIVDEVSTVIPKAPTCPNCGTPTQMRTGTILIDPPLGPCNRNLNYTHYQAIDGRFYICPNNDYTCILEDYGRYEFCTSGSHHSQYWITV